MVKLANLTTYQPLLVYLMSNKSLIRKNTRGINRSVGIGPVYTRVKKLFISVVNIRVKTVDRCPVYTLVKR